MRQLSIIIPTYNDFETVGKLAARISAVCEAHGFAYELIYVDDHSTDNTWPYLNQLARYYPLKPLLKQGKKGETQAITEGIAEARFDTVCVLDASLNYPSEAIPDFLNKIENGVSLAVANRKTKNLYGFLIKKLISKDAKIDAYSGIKMFRKAILKKIVLSKSKRAYDLELVVKARRAGFTVRGYDVFTEGKFEKKMLCGKALIDTARAVFWPKKRNIVRNYAFEKGGSQKLDTKPVATEKLPYSHKVAKITHIFYSVFALVCVSLFATWWFQPDHIPNNFTGNFVIFDKFLFLLVSYIIWHPIVMDILTWSVSSHIKDIRHQKPVPGLSVAFITTIVPSSESLDLLHKCLPAMVKAHYKHDTWLLDEGNSPEVKAICDRYGVLYFSRNGVPVYNTKTGKFTRTKGGNHNSWYDMYGHTYDIVAQIDTDFVPKMTFLTKTLGYFRDPKVAFVGTPQVYGNIHDSLIAKGAAEQLYTFYGSVLRGLSSMKMTLLIGANHIIRTSALRGVDLYSAHITEDLITGMKLHTQGWKSVYVSESLAVGEGPFSWEAYFSQQMRWAYGCMDIFFHHSPKLFKKMGFRRAIYYFFIQQHYFSGIAMALSIVLLSLYFAFGLRAADIDLFRFFAAYSFIVLLCWLMSIWLQRFNVDREHFGQLHIAGKIISVAAWPVWFLAFLCVMTGKRISYKVTPKGDSDVPVRTPIRVFMPHILFGLAATAGVISSFFTDRQSWGMMFWAVSSALLMLSVPFVEDILRGFSAVQKGLSRIIGSLYRGYRSLIQKLSFKKSRSSYAKARIYKEKVSGRARVVDSIFLGAVVVLSSILYIQHIGFYSDDWAFLGNFALSQDQSLWGLFQTAITPNTLMRPVQNFYDALLFWLFGTEPLGYQIVNTIVLSGISIMFYSVLRQLKLPRIIAISVPLVYTLLPNYTTDRFWFAVFQANLSMLFYFISLFAALKAFSLKTVWVSHWKVLSIIMLILSALSYEIAVPLYLLNVLILLNPKVIVKKLLAKRTKKERQDITFATVIVISLVYIFLFKINTSTRLNDDLDISFIIHMINSAVQVNYGMWILQIPHIWGQTISLYSTPQMFFVALLLYVSIFWYLYFVSSRPKSVFPNAGWMLKLMIISFGIFFLGYAIFLTNNQVGFSPTGIDNRVAIAAAVGVALTIVGCIGWISRLLLPERFAKVVFCVFVSVMCTGGFLVINAVSTFWIKAHQEGQMILADIRQQYPSIPKNSTLLLDGVCPYVGPAPVFEAEWDLKGALQVYYKDPTIKADIVTPRMKVYDNHIQTQIYTFPAQYSYKNLFIYNYDRKTTHYIKDSDAAHKYFNTYNPDYNNGCPIAAAGKGVAIF